MEDLMNDIGDGSALASTIAFYQPDALSIAGQLISVHLEGLD